MQRYKRHVFPCLSGRPSKWKIRQITIYVLSDHRTLKCSVEHSMFFIFLDLQNVSLASSALAFETIKHSALCFLCLYEFKVYGSLHDVFSLSRDSESHKEKDIFSLPLGLQKRSSPIAMCYLLEYHQNMRSCSPDFCLSIKTSSCQLIISLCFMSSKAWKHLLMLSLCLGLRSNTSDDMFPLLK